jgi:FkbM family methyltransferase
MRSMFHLLERLSGRLHRSLTGALHRAELAWHGRRCQAYGFQLELPRGTLSTEAAYRLLGGGIDGEDQRLLARYARPGDFVLNLGAGCGMSAMGALKHVGPTGKVVAVEADPEIHALARRNFALNDCQRIESHNAAAVADPARRSVTFYKKANYFGSNLANNFGEGRPITVPAIYPPKLIDAAFARKLLLIDVEGYETELLADRAIIDPFDLIITELHFGIYEKGGVSPLVPMLDTLAAAGFRIMDVDDEGFVFGKPPAA